MHRSTAPHGFGRNDKNLPLIPARIDLSDFNKTALPANGQVKIILNANSSH